MIHFLYRENIINGNDFALFGRVDQIKHFVELIAKNPIGVL